MHLKGKKGARCCVADGITNETSRTECTEGNHFLSGSVHDPVGKKKIHLGGSWCSNFWVELVDPVKTHYEDAQLKEPFDDSKQESQLDTVDSLLELEEGNCGGSSRCRTLTRHNFRSCGKTVVWRRASAKAGWSEFTGQLNELSPDYEMFAPKTDSRFRPDQRLYDDGEPVEAQKIKALLEEYQRKRKKIQKECHPKWFAKLTSRSISRKYFRQRDSCENYPQSHFEIFRME
eukprot:GHVP01059506.1.p1 GENE.GHVP01059506.1~~GHVP01059506.1.p1  ORF type:complete len:232 (-),score=44.71 GHVP01059506.1:231-926(-)